MEDRLGLALELEDEDGCRVDMGAATKHETHITQSRENTDSNQLSTLFGY